MKIRDSRKQRFLWLDNEIIDDHAANLGSTALLVYIYLCRRADNKSARCWPKQDTLAEFCKVSKRSIKTAIAVLKNAGLINVDVEKVEGSEYSRNVYTLLDVETGGNNLPLVSETGGSQEPKPGEATAPITRLIEQDSFLSSPSVPTGNDFQLNGDSGRQRKKPSSDPRHTPFKKEIVEFWLHLNPEFLRYEWDGADAGQLGSLLKKWPTLTLDEFDGWLTNYSESKSIVKSKTPKEFLPVIHRYAQTPLDEFQKPAKERRGAYS